MISDLCDDYSFHLSFRVEIKLIVPLVMGDQQLL